MKIEVDESTHEEVTVTVTQMRDMMEEGGEWPEEVESAWDQAQGYAFGNAGKPATLLIRIKPE